MGFPERLLAAGCHVFWMSYVSSMIVAACWNLFVVQGYWIGSWTISANNV